MLASPDTAEVTVITNRVDLFGLAHGIVVRDLIRWNAEYFHGSPRFWLAPGDELRLAPPEGETARELTVRDRMADGADTVSILVADDSRLTVETI